MPSLVESIWQVIRTIAILAIAGAITLMALPSPIRAIAWEPQRVPNLEGPLEQNERLANAERLGPGQLLAPEDVCFDAEGRIYTGTVDGKIVRFRAGAPVELYVETGGRPLGMRFVPSGDLIVADPMKGILRVSPDRTVTVLLADLAGEPLFFLNDVEVAKDGTIYFTSASQRWGYGDHVNDILEGTASGRVLRLDPVTGEVNVLARGLGFANGLALAADESFLLVSETSRYRLTKLWLSGTKRNLTETVIDNLPGFPAKLSRSPRGTTWVAMHSLRPSLLDAIQPHPFLKELVAGLPIDLRPRVRPYGLVFEVDDNGRILRSLHDPQGRRFKDVSSVIERGDFLYIGSLAGSAIGRATL